MQDDGPTGHRTTLAGGGPTTRPTPPPHGGVQDRPLRRWAVRVGVGVATLLVPFGVAVAWVGAYVGNCTWGFFGEYGPIEGAGAVTWQDLAVAATGWSIAASVWLVVAWRTRRPGLRTAAWWAVGVATAGVLALSVLPQVLLGDAHWAATCT